MQMAVDGCQALTRVADLAGGRVPPREKEGRGSRRKKQRAVVVEATVHLRPRPGAVPAR